MADDEIADWEKIMLLEQDRDKWKAEAERLAALIVPHLRCLACGATRVLPEGEPIEVSMKWFDEHERGQVVGVGSAPVVV